MLKVTQFVFNAFGENTYLVGTDSSSEAIVIDPGMSNAREREAFDAHVESEGLNITAVVLTHMHLDHCFGANYVRRRYGAKVEASADDARLGNMLGAQARSFGVALEGDERVSIDRPLKAGDTVAVGRDTLSVIAVPGHSPGGIALYNAAGKVLFSGDSLFKQSIGRTDLAGGNLAQLLDALRTRVLTLPADTIVLPGHGPSTTIGEELRNF